MVIEQYHLETMHPLVYVYNCTFTTTHELFLITSLWGALIRITTYCKVIILEVTHVYCL